MERFRRKNLKLAYNNIKLLSPRDSFLAERRKTPYFGNNWHYHIEFELLFIIKGNGVRVVGDNMSQFGDNQLVLMGSNLPHLFRNQEDKTGQTKSRWMERTQEKICAKDEITAVLFWGLVHMHFWKS